MAWQTAHKLHRVEITYTLLDERTDTPAAIQAHGYSLTKRGALWTHTERWTGDTMHEAGYEPADTLHHLILVVEQDRPNSAARLGYGLSGGLSWSEPELPFE